MSKVLYKYPYIKSYLHEHITVLKHLYLPLLSKNKKILILDSDILFFKKPKKLLNNIKNNKFSVIYSTNNFDKYSISKIESKIFLKKDFLYKLNSGLIYFPVNAIYLNLANSFLKFYDTQTLGRSLYMQTYYALLFSKYKETTYRLPISEYRIQENTFATQDLVCRHYIRGESRSLFYDDAFLLLKKMINPS